LGNVFEVVFGGACTTHVSVWRSNAMFQCVFCWWVLGSVFEVFFGGVCTTHFSVWLSNAMFQCVVGGFQAVF
jgi:hypothetical protein